MFSAHRYISRICHATLASVLTALMGVSCSDTVFDAPDVQDGESGYITIDLASSRLKTRAEADVDALNENLIQNAWIFLSPANATDASIPVLAKKVDIDENTDAAVKIPLNKTILNSLSANGTSSTCQAYVIANLPDDQSSMDGKTLGELRTLPVSADFATKEAQPSFVMDGTSTTLSIDNSKNKITGSGDLTRAASKIRIAVRVANEVTSNGVTWKPMPENMTVLIANGVKNSFVTPSGFTPGESDYFSTATNAENENHRARKLQKSEDANAAYPYELNQPFYTYPNSWSDNEEKMTYMTLMVPWGEVPADGGEPEKYLTCYYMVPVVREETAIGRNISYRVNINVNILGSFAPDEPITLDDLSYRAVDWGKEDIDVDINNYRYLVVDRNEYVMNNEEKINIPFYSSHETIVKSIVVKYFRYNTTALGITKDIVITDNQNNNSIYNNKNIYNSDVNNNINATTGTRSLIFDHPLVVWIPVDEDGIEVPLGATEPGGTTYPTSDLNERIESIDHYIRSENAETAFSKYDITITIVHKDLEDIQDTPFQQTIHIVQYPPMYIDADENNSADNPTGIGGDTRPLAPASFGNVYINGSTNENVPTYYQYWGGGYWTSVGSEYVPSGLTGGNRNPNMYIINITTLDDDRYIIGDPRQTTTSDLDYVNNRGQSRWVEAPAIGQTTQRRMSYYYPTETGESKQFFVAPKLRIASSHGVSSTYDKTVAQRRCAGYQEKNIPAGRWRLPTFGELEFIINLSNKGMIPVLFTSSSNYWTAQGPVSGSADSNGHLSFADVEEAHVRCVYDEWFWEGSTVPQSGTVSYNNQTAPRYPFTWGDKQR